MGFNVVFDKNPTNQNTPLDGEEVLTFHHYTYIERAIKYIGIKFSYYCYAYGSYQGRILFI